jgi:hypothetical protein
MSGQDGAELERKRREEAAALRNDAVKSRRDFDANRAERRQREREDRRAAKLALIQRMSR